MVALSGTSGVQKTILRKFFFTGGELDKIKVFLEEMSDQTIELTHENSAYYVAYCKQNKLKVNEAKTLAKPKRCNKLRI